MIFMNSITLHIKKVGIYGLLASLLTVPVKAYTEQIKLPEGSLVELKLLDNLSSKSNTEGQAISFEVLNNVTAENSTVTLIKAGSMAKGYITNVEERGRMGRKGELSINVDSARAIDGTRIPLRATTNKNGRDKTGSVIALSLIISPLFLLMHGKDATIPSGTKLNAYVDQPVLVTLPNENDNIQNTNPTAISAIEALKKLKEQGLLSEEEFQSKLKKVND